MLITCYSSSYWGAPGLSSWTLLSTEHFSIYCTVYDVISIYHSETWPMKTLIWVPTKMHNIFRETFLQNFNCPLSHLFSQTVSSSLVLHDKKLILQEIVLVNRFIIHFNYYYFCWFQHATHKYFLHRCTFLVCTTILLRNHMNTTSYKYFHAQ